ncbi:MAG TPA: hypothetical protein DEQ09_02425 [Bacteroidales bacterium]|nr:hypothetical protein [Bacteroidales bacterium]
MKHEIEIIQDGESISIKAGDGEVLLDVLRTKGYNIYSPCGGEGTCGKCTVHIIGKGTVAACRYIISEDITVILPGAGEMNVLSTQYENTVDIDFMPFYDARLSGRPVGCALDIGTTTMVYYFIDLKDGTLLRTYSDINPQVRYGADVISRINYCTENDDGLETLQSLLAGSVNSNIRRLINDTQRKEDDIISINIAGNTTMLHLMAGVDPSPIAFAPFTPVFTEQKNLNPSKLGININEQASIKMLPSVSAYVGSDIVAGLASIDLEGYETCLYIDIGTNGEIVLVNKNKIFACATAAGPAFEGARISCGCPAVEGAINTFKEGYFTTIGRTDPVGVCGSGLVDIIAYMLDKGLVSATGEITDELEIFTDGKKDLRITQQDIREVQLAKAAISAGIDILLRRGGCCYDDVELLILAGGFGNYISVDNAMRTGILPAELKNKVIQAGNAAGTGALLALKSREFNHQLDKLASRIEYIELSADREFAKLYVDRMNFE